MVSVRPERARTTTLDWIPRSHQGPPVVYCTAAAKLCGRSNALSPRLRSGELRLVLELPAVQAVRLREVEDAAAVVDGLREGVAELEPEALGELPAGPRLQRVVDRGALVHEGPEADHGRHRARQLGGERVSGLGHLDGPLVGDLVDTAAQRQVITARADVAQVHDGAAEQLALDPEVPLERVGQRAHVAVLRGAGQRVGRGGGPLRREGIAVEGRREGWPSDRRKGWAIPTPRSAKFWRTVKPG